MSDGMAYLLPFLRIRRIFMQKTKPQLLFFTAITAFITAYGMTLYNTVLAYFVSSRFAKEFAFKVVKPADSKIYFQTYI